MNRIALFAVIAVALACGGAQGPAGPAGPPGPTGATGPAGSGTGGGKFTWDVPANEKEWYVATFGNPPPTSRTFNLADQVAMPVTATSVYVELTACLPAGVGQPGVASFKSPQFNNPTELDVAIPCPSGGTDVPRDPVTVWMPIDSSQSIDVTVRTRSIGGEAAALARVRVLAWYEP